MEDFSSTGQLVTLGLVDSSIGAMAKGLALVNVEASIAKELLCHLIFRINWYFDFSAGRTLINPLFAEFDVQCIVSHPDHKPR